MEIKIGTFNLNNLFSRHNFESEIEALRDAETDVESDVRYTFGPASTYKIRTYKGRLVAAKKPEDTKKVADRVISMDVDVLAVQEVEDIDTLKQFNREHLKGLYKYVGLIEGNDLRLIDVGILSKLPIASMTSCQHAVHPDDPNEPIFGRDLLEIDILTPSRSKKLFTLFNNHLKSHYVDYREDKVEGEKKNNLRRSRQAEVIGTIVKDRTRPDIRYIILGDMNDPPDSRYLRWFVRDNELKLTNALSNPKETRPPKADGHPPASTA
jgi:endonuclease/exonuclease/phosphatase family metal-dependent hydrolase